MDGLPLSHWNQNESSIMCINFGDFFSFITLLNRAKGDVTTDKICKMKNVARSLAGVFLDLASFERGRIRTFSHSQEVESHRQCCGCAGGLGAKKLFVD